MLSSLRQREFGEILGDAWGLTKRTIPTAGLLLFLIYMPLMLAVGFLMESIFDGFSGIVELQRLEMEGGGELDPDVAMGMMMPFIKMMFIIAPMSLIYQLLQPFGHTAATLVSWEALNGNNLSFGEMVRRTFGRPFWYVVAQGLIIGAIAALSSGALMFVALIAGIATFGIGSLLVYMGYYGGMIYIMVAIIFRIHHIVVEERGPWQALIASIALTKNNWWRVFAVVAIISVVSTLLVIPIIIPQIISLVSSLTTLPPPPQGGNDPEYTAALFAALDQAISPWTFAAFGLVIPAISLFMINTLTLLYADLRARRGDFTEIEDEEEDGDLMVRVSE